MICVKWESKKSPCPECQERFVKPEAEKLRRELGLKSASWPLRARAHLDAWWPLYLVFLVPVILVLSYLAGILLKPNGC